MKPDDRTYFTERAEQELELAQHATKPEAVAAHDQLAEAYLERAEQSESEATPG